MGSNDRPINKDSINKKATAVYDITTLPLPFY